MKIKNPIKFDNNNISKPQIAGVLLIISAIFSIILWMNFLTADIQEDDLDTLNNSSYVKNLDGNLTIEQIKQTNTTCGTVGIILSIFTILAAFCAIKRKKWKIAMIGGLPLMSVCILIMIFTGVLIVDILLISICLLIGLYLIYISKSEFQ